MKIWSQGQVVWQGETWGRLGPPFINMGAKGDIHGWQNEKGELKLKVGMELRV